MLARAIAVIFVFACGYLLPAQSAEGFATRYLQTVGKHAVLFHGNLQEERLPTTNHPYLVSRAYAIARLSYRGIVYPEVLLRLDLSRDELIVFSEGRHIVLSRENLDYANLHHRHIVYINNGYLPAGLYMVLHSGKTTVLKRQVATLNYRQVSSSRIERHFLFTTTYFLYKDGVYHTIRNRRGLLRLLYPHQRALSRFISTNRLNLRGRTEEMITLTVIAYERLSALQAAPLSKSL
jgi:hypothetical protein